MIKSQLYLKRSLLYQQGDEEGAAKVQEEINNLCEEIFNKPLIK